MIPGLEILNLHAQGGMAEVYRARGLGADGRMWPYAVKRILPEFTRDEMLRGMFVEEARIASLLLHPNIVRVYDLVRADNDDYYIVMEFLEGRDLAELGDKALEQGHRLPIWLCIHTAREMCKALNYATSQALDREGRPLGLIHRDISPHNIFVCFDGQVKLTDFGVAKVAQSKVLTQVGVTKGKFGYMSPEQLMSEKLDFRSDLFNIGILLYETLGGRRLFYGDNPSQFLQAMLRAEVPPLARELGVPAELESLMRRALAKDRAHRPATAQLFDDELRAIAERFGLEATQEQVATEVRSLMGTNALPPQRPLTTPMLPSVVAPANAEPSAVKRTSSKVVAARRQPVANRQGSTSGSRSQASPRLELSTAQAPSESDPQTLSLKASAQRTDSETESGESVASEPDGNQTETMKIPTRRATVIAVGGAGAKSLGGGASDSWDDATGEASANHPPDASVVKRSPRVVPLPSPKKKR